MSEYEATPEKEVVDQRQRLRRYVDQLLETAPLPSDSCDESDDLLPTSSIIADGYHTIAGGRMVVAELIDISDYFAENNAPIEAEYLVRLGIHNALDGSCEYELTTNGCDALGQLGSQPIATYLQGGSYYDYAANNKMEYFDAVVDMFFEKFKGIIPPEAA